MESRLETHEALISQAKSDLKTSQIISELTMEKAEALPKDNKKLHWLSIVTLGITSIVAAARKGWAEERKGAALKLNDANAKLSAGLESVKLPDRAEVQQEDVSYDDFATMQFEQPKVEPVKIEKKNRQKKNRNSFY